MTLEKKWLAMFAFGTALASGSAAQAMTCEGEQEQLAQRYERETQDGESVPQVKVLANGEEVDVPAVDAKPNESWFGMPPGEKTVENYLEAAGIAAEKGDEEACLEQLENARTAMDR
ncbi:hypothetical protein [Roseibium sp.]|uniref:hypothetical protein n=1 Tax=Roseibium sp. TaxID=1936156 RepID=UPI003A97E1DE